MGEWYQHSTQRSEVGGPDVRTFRLYLAIYALFLIATLTVIMSSRAFGSCLPPECVRIASLEPDAAAWFVSIADSLDQLRFVVIGYVILNTFLMSSLTFFTMWRGRWL